MMLCTHAITGSAYPTYQPIYICETCHPPTQSSSSSSSSEFPLPKCICQSCAMTCHVGHTIVTYVGVGPCTCDCCNDDEEEIAMMENRHSCLLAETSKREACKLLGATSNSHNGVLLNSPMAKEQSLNDEHSPLRRSYMDGYICDSFTLSHLKEGGDNNEGPPTTLQLCENLIQQAIELANLSKETFWIPDGSVDDDTNGEYCELELLARTIYRHHISLYSLSSQPSLSLSSGEAERGAEWWVQVKRPSSSSNSSIANSSSSKSTVDLHYDKDESLAETFGLGSFPTLSTVTYLTDSIDNVPTIIFPHTYHDEEERTIGSMALSIPKIGKHVVFDGQLLHGAPYHSSLLRPHTTTAATNRQQRQCDGNYIVSEGGVMMTNDDNYISSSSSSLRVTFLVNIWTCRKPSNVHVLPASIRNIISTSHSSTTTTANDNANMSSLRRVIPLITFEPRFIHEITIPLSPLSFGWANNSQRTRTKMLDKIILPFVSKSATWIDDDSNENVGVEEVDDITMYDGEELTTTDVKTRVAEENGGNDEIMQDSDDDDTGIEEDEEDGDDEDDDLFLVLPPLFATDEYMNDNTNDTFIFKFDGNDNGAQLIRGGELREMGYTIHFVGDDHKIEVIAHEFLSKLRKEVPIFVSSIITNLNSQYGMDVTNYQADHVCYRTETAYEYTRLVKALQADTNNIHLLVESEIGGRLIATFKLTMPIEIVNPCITAVDSSSSSSSSSTRLIDVIEIPSPKKGSPYIFGLEHVEFVIGNNRLLHNNNYSPINDNNNNVHHQLTLQAWMESFPCISWNTKALNKYCNPDVSTTLSLPDWGGKEVSVKFHLLPLEDVIKFEESM